MLKEKIKAFLVHLTVSMILALICIAIVYFVWNPYPLYKATGITQIFLLMLVIDIILGPILTFVIYKKGKKTLKFDLATIAILQLVALTYGMYHVFETRPIWLVYDLTRFELIQANEIDRQDITKAKPEYQKQSLTGANYVAVNIPKDNPDLRNQMIFEQMASGIAPTQRPELYGSLDIAKADIIKNAKNLEELNQYNNPEQVAKVLSKYPEADSFVPLKANEEDMSVLINKKQGGKVVAIVDLRPWK